MRTVMGAAAAALAVIVLSACAHDPPPAPGNPVPDTLDVAAIDAEIEGRFVERHAAVLLELASRERSGDRGADVIEARALVETAEETYIGGDVSLALGFVEDAARLLRRDP